MNDKIKNKELEWENYENMLKRKEKSEAKKKAKTINVVYAEPPEYFPEDLRRKFKLGKFAEPKEDKK